MRELGTIINQHPDHTIVAVLHGNINHSILRYMRQKGIEGIYRLMMGNCSLYEIQKEGGSIKIVGDYKSNEDLESLL